MKKNKKKLQETVLRYGSNKWIMQRSIQIEVLQTKRKEESVLKKKVFKENITMKLFENALLR